MDEKKLKTAVEEAKRFLDRVKELQNEQKITVRYFVGEKEYTHIPSCPKESGAVRRASMDLSRALAALRKY